MTVDLTGIAIAATGGVFSIIGIVLTAWLQAHVKNQAALAAYEQASTDAVGAVQQATEQLAKGIKPITVKIPGATPEMEVGVQFVLDHAGPEVAHLGVTPSLVANKIEAKIGLASVASNIQAAASSEPTPAPVSPVPVPVPAKVA